MCYTSLHGSTAIRLAPPFRGSKEPKMATTTTKKTSAGATVTVKPASTFTTAAPKRKAGAPKRKAGATKASPLPTVATAAQPVATPAPVVALRSGPVVQAVTMGTKVYRVKAEHNLAAWRAVQALMTNGPAPMPTVLETIKQHPSLGGASGFMQYCLRRGYLVAA